MTESLNVKNYQSVCKTLKKMSYAIESSFKGHNDIYKGFYALLCSKAYINKFLYENNLKENAQIKDLLNGVLSEYMEEIKMIPCQQSN